MSQDTSHEWTAFDMAAKLGLGKKNGTLVCMT